MEVESESGLPENVDPPADKDKSTAPGKQGGQPLELLRSLNLSDTLKRVIRFAQSIAKAEKFQGLYGTGLFLIALARRGQEARDHDRFYPPRFVFNWLRSHASGPWASAKARYFEVNADNAAGAAAPRDHVSKDLWHAFEYAGSLPAHDGVLASRHLAVALLAFRRPDRPEPNSWQLLADANVDRHALLIALLDDIIANAHDEEREAWNKLRSDCQREVTDHQQAWIPGYDDDRPSGRSRDDCLKLNATVGAMANLIASPQLEGALSIGVFGNWGSGKSFFMSLLRRAIGDIADKARRTNSPDRAPSYWSNVVQVEFNAWHYVDANLWASLMSHLLDELRRWSPPSEEEHGEPTPLANALEQLEIASAARREARARQAQAQKIHVEAVARRKAAEDKYQHAEHQLRDIVATSLWSFFEDDIEPTREQAIDALNELGVHTVNAQASVAQIFAQVRDVTSTSGRLHVIANRLLKEDGSGRKLFYLALMAAAAVALVVVGSIWIEPLRNAAAVVGSAIVTAIAVATKAVTWIQQAATTVYQQLEPLRSIRATIEQRLDAAETDKAHRISQHEREVATCSAALAVATAEVVARDEDVRAATQAVENSVSGRAVREFIERRLASGDYQRHLGLIATIRRDFEQLSELIRAHNSLRLGLHNDFDTIKSAYCRAYPEGHNDEQLQQLFDEIGINRIVLYVDDLDRCPPERVVEVLQAIHLLLSFPIFVVVVGVDARWMSKSLARQYPTLLERSQAGTTVTDRIPTSDDVPVTPSDYLEKIFQIPFWVPPLQTKSAQDLIGKLVTPVTATRADNPGDDHQDTDESRHEASGKAPTEAEQEQHSASVLPAQPPATQPAANEANHAETVAEPTVILRPDLLEVPQDQCTAMQSLAAIVGRSPRATKRFVNSYRLLKVAMLGDGHVKRDLDGGVRGLDAPMFLLAVVIGLPTLAGDYIAMLPANANVGAVDQLVALAEWAASDPARANDVARIREFVRRSPSPEWLELTGSDLERWTQRVGQFSFEDLVVGGATRRN